MIGSLDEIAARLESIQERPELVCKRKAHMRDPEEASRPPAKWRARCGWPYGYSNFLLPVGHTTMGRKFCVSSVSLRPRKGPGRRRPRLNSPTPSRQTATTHPHRARRSLAATGAQERKALGVVGQVSL